MAVTEGGIIGKQNTTTATSASGMWTLNETFLRNTVMSKWPNFNVPASISYSILSGGGGGHQVVSPARNMYGGGSGAVPVTGTFAPASGTTYVVTVGAGGGSTSTYGQRTDGGTSSITGIATGSAGRCTNGEMGASNDSYGGGFYSSVGGGGGAGAGEGSESGPNQATGSTGGNGGAGVVMPLHPTSLRVGGGGAGGCSNIFNSGDATDGGGRSGHYSLVIVPGVNRGGGGGGATYNTSNHQSGGSGRVILRYPEAAPPATTTGTVTYTISGGYRYYDFTSSGSLSF